MVLMEAGLHGVGTGEMKQEVKQRERIFSHHQKNAGDSNGFSMWVCLFVYLALAYKGLHCFPELTQLQNNGRP